jgi:hypothetical protein
MLLIVLMIKLTGPSLPAAAIARISTWAAARRETSLVSVEG